MKIYIGSDHGGYELKNKIVDFLKEKNYDINDMGPHVYDSEDDYPDYIIPTCEKVVEHKDNLGIVLGGSGQGEAIAANKVKGIRAMTFYSPVLAIDAVDVTGRMSKDPFENLKLAKEHNHSNVLSIGARFIDFETIKKAIIVWIETPYGNIERHMRRIKKIEDYENKK
jgi:ribose 5-phosphate isomerase B